MDSSAESYSDLDPRRPGSDEIVVATPFLDAVVAKLGDSAEEAAADSRLGLTRVRLTDPAAAAASVSEDLVGADYRLSPGSAQLRVRTDVEKVLAGLRVSFARQWSGWFPVMGKNRVMLGGEGSPYMVIRGNEEPEPVDPGESFGAEPGAEVGGRGLTIGLVDTPVVARAAFRDALLPGSTLLDVREPLSYRLGHATFLAGLVAAQAPQARILVKGVLRGKDATASAWDVAVALLDLADAGVDIITLSIGCFTLDSQPPLVLQTAVSMVRDQALIVAASGNHGSVTATAAKLEAGSDPGSEQTASTDVKSTTPLWPAALDGVLGVGGHDGTDDGLASFSPPAPWVRLLAPGTPSVSTFLDGPVELETRRRTFAGLAKWSGSSMSAAIAAGRFAALAATSVQEVAHPSRKQRRAALDAAVSAVLKGQDRPILRPYSP